MAHSEAPKISSAAEAWRHRFAVASAARAAPRPAEPTAVSSSKAGGGVWWDLEWR